MKTATILLVVLLWVGSGHAQNCSQGSGPLTGIQTTIGGSGDCTCSDEASGGNPIQMTFNYNFSCTKTSGSDAPGQQYFFVSSSLLGNGKCFVTTNHDPTKPRCPPPDPPLNCPPFNESQVTQATGPTDFNRFYNRVWDGVVQSGECIKGTFQQDFRQCAGQACNGSTAGVGGGGGDPCLGGGGPDPGTGPGFSGGGGGSPDPTCSPIIIDTEGEGFHLTSAANGVMFDIRADHHPVHIAWTARGSRNAFLALDRNGDGVINNGAELFGNFTLQPTSSHPNGFLALAEFDKPENGGNGDGVIDEHDTVFSKLRLWIDENHDGVSQPSELHTLPELGVFAVALDYQTSPKRDQYGNEFRFKARINPGERRDKRDEASEVGRWSYDVFLTANQ